MAKRTHPPYPFDAKTNKPTTLIQDPSNGSGKALAKDTHVHVHFEDNGWGAVTTEDDDSGSLPVTSYDPE